MTAIPPLADLAALCLALGAMFVARFALALRRLDREGGGTGALRLGASLRAALRPGDGLEPERRHAARQLSVGVAFLALAAILGGSLLVRRLF